jgi:hypothetical protein
MNIKYTNPLLSYATLTNDFVTAANVAQENVIPDLAQSPTPNALSSSESTSNGNWGKAFVTITLVLATAALAYIIYSAYEERKQNENVE